MADEAPLTLARLWREMTPEQRLAAAETFWLDDESMAQQVEAVTHLARQLHFRPQSVLGMPADRKARQLAMLGKVPDNVIARALVVYHLVKQRPMLVAFLDQLGIPHEDGLISEGVEQKPTEAQMASAVSALLATFPEVDVRLYVKTLAIQDPDTWGSLAGTAVSV